MFKITSAKKNIIAESGLNGSVEFHNQLFGTDDCVVEELPDVVYSPPAPPTAAEKEKAEEIASCRQFLANTDYKILRQTEQNTMSAEDYALLLAERQAKRDRINEL
jgi:hypothetical protein